MEESGPESTPEPAPPTPSPQPMSQPAPAGRGMGLWIGIVVIIVVIAVIVAAVFAGWFGPLFGPTKQLRVATILDKTGSLGVFGVPNEQGAKLAIEQINAQGGVFGVDIAAFHEDSQTLAAAARDAANKVVSTNQVHGIIGSTGSGQCLAIIEIAKANNVFEMSGSCTSPILSEAGTSGGWFARTAPSDALQGVVAGFYMAQSYDNVAVIGINNPYGTGLADVFATSFASYAGKTITINRIVTEVGAGATTYVPDLDAVFATNPEAIYLVAYPPDGILMLEEWDAGTYADIPWVFSEGLLSQSGFVDELVARNIATTNFEGTTPGSYVGLVGPRWATWAEDFEARWDSTPSLFDDNVYDAMFLMALAAEYSGEASGSGIQSAIQTVANPPGTTILPGEWAKALTEIAAGRDINYEGASGTTDLDASGDPLISQYAVWGIDANDSIETRQVFDEDDVANLLPAPPHLLMAKLPAFMVSWDAIDRWT